MSQELDQIAIKLNDYVRREEAYFWLEDFDDLNEAQRALIGVWEIRNEIQNGGFLQYFQNFSGSRAPIIADVLRDIGAAESASIVDRATALAGCSSSWRDEGERFTAVERLSVDVKKQISDLDSAFEGEAAKMHAQLFDYLFERRHQLPGSDALWREVK
jgi:hypothetical protein